MRTNLPVVPYAVHAIGIVAAWTRTAGHEIPDVSIHPLFILICAAPSAALAVLYLSLDWWSARGVRVPGRVRILIQKIRAKWLPMAVAALLCLSLAGAGEILHIRKMKERMSEIKAGMTRSEVLQRLGTPQWQMRAYKGEIPKSLEDMYPAITRFIYQLSLFDRSGIVIFIDDKNERVIWVIR